MKTAAPKVHAKAIGKPPTRKMSSKPRIRMQKLRPVAQSAFPTAAAAFPTDGAPAGPDQAMAPGPMSAGAAPGMTQE